MTSTPTHTTVPGSVVRRLVTLACRAPSVHNTQPWLWRLRHDGFDLHADQRCRLPVTDPDGSELLISCGAALHHAGVAARASGWSATVERLPDEAEPDLLARVRLAPTEPTATAAEDLQALLDRRTDRRRFTNWPVPDERLEKLASLAREQGTGALALTDVTDRFRVELLVSRALQLQMRDPAVTAEQRAWRDRPENDGVPTTTIPDQPADETSYRSRFGVGSLDDPGRDIEGTDGLVLLYAEHGEPEAWLRCGEGLSALWLHAVRSGLSVVPLSQVAEVTETNAALRHEVLGGLAVPLLLVRVGWQAIGRSDLPPSPRRPLRRVLLP
jgi:hypothetical protein